MRQSKHKELWKHLYLTWVSSNDEEAQLRHPGGAGGEGDDEHHDGGGLADSGAVVEVPSRVHRPGETVVQPLGGAHDLQDGPEADDRHQHQGGTGEAKHERERGGEHSVKRVKLVGPGHGAADAQGDGGGSGGILHRGGGHPKEHTDATKQPMKVSKWRGRPKIVKRDQLSQLSMFNYTSKTVGGGVISARQGSEGSQGVNTFRVDKLDTDLDSLHG